jgi:hypothetical protein
MATASKPVSQDLPITVSISQLSSRRSAPLHVTGQPIEALTLGETFLPKDVIWEYLESLKEIYTVEVSLQHSTQALYAATDPAEV